MDSVLRQHIIPLSKPGREIGGKCMYRKGNCTAILNSTCQTKKNDLLWLKWMAWGKRLGCHQMPERSFFFKGYQFPVCARCTGVLVSSIAACMVFFRYPLGWQWCIGLCFVMFLDWFIQWTGIRKSTNIRRLVTGLVGGYGCMTLQLYLYKMAAGWMHNALDFIWR